MKFLFYLFFLFIPVNLAFASDDTEQLDLLVQVCNTSKSAFEVYQANVSTPPVMGGEIGRTTFADICDLLVKLQRLNGKARDLQEKLGLNDKTQSNWDKNRTLALAVGTFLMSSHYDEATSKDVGELETERERESLKDFYSSIGDSGEINALKFEDDRKAASEIDKFARTVRQRSMLSQSLICPDNSDNPDYREIYTKELRPLTIERERYQLKRDHYYARLQEIGPTFLSSTPAAEYYRDLENLQAFGIVIKTSDEKTTAPSFTKSAPRKEGEAAKVNKSSVPETTQSFFSSTDVSAFEKFREKWKARWKDHFDQTFDKIDKNLDVVDECIAGPNSPPKTDWLNPDQVNAYADYERRCYFAQARKTTTPPALIFEEDISRYKDNWVKYAALQAQIWTRESKLLKRKLVFDSKHDGGISLSDKPNCDNKTPLNEAEYKKKESKLLGVENEYRQIIASEKIKDSFLRDEENRKQQEYNQDQKTKARLIQGRKTEEGKFNLNFSPSLDGSL